MSNEDNVVEIDEEVKEITSVEKVVEENKLHKHIIMIYASLEASQRIKAGLTMQDCKNLILAKESLLKFFDEEKSEVTGDDAATHLNVFISCCQVQQANGVFSFDGSVKLLDALEELSKAVEAAKSPQLKIKEVNAKFQNMRLKPTNVRSPAPQNNKNRPGGGVKISPKK